MGCITRTVQNFFVCCNRYTQIKYSNILNCNYQIMEQSLWFRHKERNVQILSDLLIPKITAKSGQQWEKFPSLKHGNLSKVSHFLKIFGQACVLFVKIHMEISQINQDCND